MALTQDLHELVIQMRHSCIFLQMKYIGISDKNANSSHKQAWLNDFTAVIRADHIMVPWVLRQSPEYLGLCSLCVEQYENE